MNREILEQAAYERRRDRAAETIFPFLKRMVQRGKAEPATYNRDAVSLVLDAIRSRHFMDLVEQDPDLSYDLKMQISHMNSGLNKSWPATRRLIYSDKSDELAGIALAVVDHLTMVLEACGVRYLEVDQDAGTGSEETTVD